MSFIGDPEMGQGLVLEVSPKIELTALEGTSFRIKDNTNGFTRISDGLRTEMK